MRSALPRRAALGLVTAGLALPLAALTPSAAFADTGAGAGHHRAAPGAVFVQLNAASGNAIAAYARAGDGTLTAAGTVPTGGLGGTAVGAPLDALASQGSLGLDERHRVLVAVNAGSDTITSFSVDGTRLRRRSVVASSGQFPVSVAVRGDLAFVLNAGGHGSVSGFRLDDGRLSPIAGTTRDLGLGNTAVPTFITAPSQVGFTPDGHTLVVATKANNTLLTFHVDGAGHLAAAPVVTPSAGKVPFSFVTDPSGGIHVTNAGDGTQTSYRVGAGGGLVALGTSAPTGGAALCWNVRVGGTVYGANAGSATLSAWQVTPGGATTLTAPVAATTGAGPIDLATSADGRFLYAQDAVAGALSSYTVGADGSLTALQTVSGLPAFSKGGMEGLAAF